MMFEQRNSVKCVTSPLITFFRSVHRILQSPILTWAPPSKYNNNFNGEFPFLAESLPKRFLTRRICVLITKCDSGTSTYITIKVHIIK